MTDCLITKLKHQLDVAMNSMLLYIHHRDAWAQTNRMRGRTANANWPFNGSVSLEDYNQLHAIYVALSHDDSAHDDIVTSYPCLVRDINNGTAGDNMQAMVMANACLYRFTSNGGDDTVADVFADYETYVRNFVDKHR